MTIKPKTRKAPAPKAPTAPEMEFDIDKELAGDWHAIVEAEDTLGEASKLADAINLMALELGEYECGAICSVAKAIKDKIEDGLGLLDAYEKVSGVATRQIEAAKKVMGRA